MRAPATMGRDRKLWIAVACGVVAGLSLVLGAAPAFAQARAPVSPPYSIDQPPPPPPRHEIGVLAGWRAAASGADVDYQSPWGPFASFGPGMVHDGYSVAAHLGYQVHRRQGWSLRPGARASRAWMQTSACMPQACIFDFLILEVGLRYHGPSGFVFETEVPVVGWIPGEARTPGSRASIALYTYPAIALM